MKKILASVMMAAFVLFAVAGNAGATWWESYCPSCQTEFWDTKSVDNWFNVSGESKSWTFNLNMDALTPSGASIDSNDVINKAVLQIHFYGDGDLQGEYAKLVVDGSTLDSSFEASPGWSAGFNVTTTLSDHILNVTVKQAYGDFGVDQLSIHGCYTPVPEPMSLLLLGLGLLGIGAVRRKK